jgi:hypothetical protein
VKHQDNTDTSTEGQPDQVALSSGPGRTLSITITGVPVLPRTKRRGSCIAALGEAFGRETIAAGFNVAEDMPSEAAYNRAAVVVLEMMNRGSIDLALLVNLIAAVDGEATP